MKKLTKVIALILIASLMLISLTACDEQKKAESTVYGMLGAFKNLDFNSAQKYVNISDLKISGQMLDLSEKENLLMKNLFNKLNYKIISSEKIDNNTVKVKTEITAIDMKPVMQEMIANAMTFALSNAFSKNVSDEDVNKKMDDLFLQSMKKPDLATVKNTVDIKVIKVKGAWKVAADEKLTDALFGGLLTVTKDMEKTFNQFGQ